MIHVQDLTAALVSHPLYRSIRDEQALRVFMRAHVFCVWDFMSLLKTLQRELTGIEVPWFPKGDREARRFINDIVVAEESDLHPAGGYASHYELYADAMQACGADRAPIERFLERLRAGRGLAAAFAAPEMPNGVREFVGTTFGFLENGELHRIAAAFTYGREDVIPAMFRRLVQELAQRAPQHWGTFLFYLERHIEVDGEHHGPLAHRLLARLCGDDLQKWREAEQAARQALVARLALWDAVLADIRAADHGMGQLAAGG
jgi:hypothetical protein